MSTYSEKLRDPRWQKMRLKKLEAAAWRCELCSDGGTTLNVHHKRYIKGHAPWEYDEAELVVLCEPCHETEHEAKEVRSALLARLDVDGPLGIDDFLAFGAGSLPEHMLTDEETRRLVFEIETSKPVTFCLGRLARSIYRSQITFLGALRLRLLLDGDAAFLAEWECLLRKHGVSFRRDEQEVPKSA